MTVITVFGQKTHIFDRKPKIEQIISFSNTEVKEINE